MLGMEAKSIPLEQRLDRIEELLRRFIMSSEGGTPSEGTAEKDAAFMLQSEQAIRVSSGMGGAKGLALPDIRLVEIVIKGRQLRQEFLPSRTFFDPQWNMLLDLLSATLRMRRLCTTSLCIASEVPMTTALRHLDELRDSGLVTKTRDPLDGRRFYVELTPKALRALAAYFATLLDMVSQAQPTVISAKGISVV